MENFSNFRIFDREKSNSTIFKHFLAPRQTDLKYFEFR